MPPTAIYSNGTWGTVAAITDGTDTVALPERVDGAFQWPTRKQTRSENPPVAITVSHPSNDGRTETLSVQFEPLTLTVIPAKWLEWVADGLITDELLAEVPEPDDVKAARLLAEAKSAGVAQVDAWWASQAKAGIPVTGKLGTINLGSDSADAVALEALRTKLVGAPDDTQSLVTDVNGNPYPTTAGEFAELAVVYENEFNRRRGLWGTVKFTVNTATTVEAIETALKALT